MRLSGLSILVFLILPVVPLRAQPYAGNVARAEAYLVRHFNPELGLVYESDDAGQHWLRREFNDFIWHYNQTYWLYSDNLFAYLALKRDYPDISNRIMDTIAAYHQPPPNFFEVVSGLRIRLPLHDAEDFVVSENGDFVVMIRSHNSTRLALGNYVDFWMYEALEYALEGNLASASFLVRQAESLWRGDGLWDWSFTLFDHNFSNQKLALLIFTARAIGLPLAQEDEMEAHLWSMQNLDGGVASLSDPKGTKSGSANAETTALAILIYNGELLSRFPKAQPPIMQQPAGLAIPILAVSLLVVLLFQSRRKP